MRRPGKYRVFLMDGSELETSYCYLTPTVDNNFLVEKDPGEFGRGVIRTFVLTNVKYWEPIE